MKTLILDKSDVAKGSLILVNKRHPIIYAADSKSLLGIDKHGHILLTQKAAALFIQLLKDIKCNNKIIPVSGYRSYEEQKKIYTQSLFSNGRKFTEQFVALPNCSEHQTGLAIDVAKNSDKINFLCPDFPDNGICGEFKKKSIDYGFIQRYKKEKENITGISCESWHFRYVGIPHARIISDNNFCLEEYITFIKGFKYQKKHLIINGGQVEFEIFYIDINKTESIEIDDNYCIDISGSNEDGLIATFWRNKQ